MSDGIVAKLIEAIASHPNIRASAEPDISLLSVIAPHILQWLCTNPTQGWNAQKRKNIRDLYEIGNYNRAMVENLFNCALSLDAIEMATLFGPILKEKIEKAKKAIKAKEDKIADASYTHKTALHRAAGAGEIDKVKKLLDDSEVDCNYGDENEMTPIHHAAKKGHSDVVKLLLADSKVDRNYGDQRGMTPIHHAAKKGHSDVVKLLLADSKVDRDYGDQSGMTPIHHAAKNGHSDVVELLDELEAKTNKQDHRGNTPLMLAVLKNAKTQPGGDERKSYMKIMHILLRIEEAPIYVFNHQYHTPFSTAIETNQEEVRFVFLEHQKLVEAYREADVTGSVANRGRTRERVKYHDRSAH